MQSSVSSETINYIIFGIEITVMVVAVMMIVVGLIQNKKSQTGLSALNGGNEELFSNSKERGLDKTMSIWMFSLGIALFILAIIAALLNNLFL